MIRTDYSDGTNEQFTYDAKGNMTGQVDQAGNERSFTYDSKGQVLIRTNPLGGVTTYTYNGDGTLSSQKDSETGTATYEYDSLRRLTKVIHPDGTTKQFAYDLNDRLISETLENGNTASQTFDANGNLIARTDHSGKITRYVYDLMDRNVEITDRLGKVSKTIYDVLGHVSSWIDANGDTMGFGYNENGWQTQMIDGEGKIWLTEYDAVGREIAHISPSGGTVRYERDKSGNRTKITDSLGNNVNYAYDSMSRLTSADDPIGRQMQFSYNNLGLLSSLTQSGIGTSPAYTYNGLGLLSTVTDMRRMDWSFGYTPIGRLSSQRDPLGNQTRFSYDQRGRRTEVIHPTGETQVASLDGEGNIIRMVYSDGTDLPFTYDAIGRLTSTIGVSLSYDREGNVADTEDGGVHFGASYDDGGRLKQVTYNNDSFTVTYTYDRRSFLIRVTDSLTGATMDFTYDDDGRLTRLARSNGITTTYSWNAAGRPTRIQDGAIADKQYSYNAAGEITQVVQNLPLDPASLFNSRTDSFTYDDASQVRSPGFTFDARGQQTASPTNSLTWDASGGLRGTGTATLEHNGKGDLLRRTEGGVTTHYYYNGAVGSNIMAERNEGTGQFLRYYIWAPEGRLLYMIDTSNNKVYFYHFDHLGSTLFLTDSTGSVTDAYAYTPYGVMMGHNGPNPQPFTFLGQYGVRQEDTGGIYQIKSRYYDAATARFLSRDPSWPQLTAWDGLNPYLYARANPVMYHDVSGRSVASPFVKALLGSLTKEAGKKFALHGGKVIGSNTVQYAIKTGITKQEAKGQLSELRDQMLAPVYQEGKKQLDPYMKGFSFGDLGKELLNPVNYIPYSWVTIPAEIANSQYVIKGVSGVLNVVADSEMSTKQKIGNIESIKEAILDMITPEFGRSMGAPAQRSAWNLPDLEFADMALKHLRELLRIERMFTTIICEAEKEGISSADDLIKSVTEFSSLDPAEEHVLRLMWLEKHAPAEVQNEK